MRVKSIEEGVVRFQNPLNDSITESKTLKKIGLLRTVVFKRNHYMVFPLSSGDSILSPINPNYSVSLQGKRRNNSVDLELYLRIIEGNNKHKERGNIERFAINYVETPHGKTLEVGTSIEDYVEIIKEAYYGISSHFAKIKGKEVNVDIFVEVDKVTISALYEKQ